MSGLDFGEQYPSRPQFYANDFLRIIEREALALQYGTSACWLLAVIVLTEDKARYRRAPWFRMRALETRVGLKKDAIRVIVRNLVCDGWLYWSQVNNRAPIYAWVKEPHWLQIIAPQKGIDGKTVDSPVDSPVDHTSSTILSPTLIPPPPPSSAVWEMVRIEMLKIGIAETSEPLRCLTANGCTPDEALGILRYASLYPIWKLGKVRRRLCNLLPGQSPSNRSLWMAPDSCWTPPPDPAEVAQFKAECEQRGEEFKRQEATANAARKRELLALAEKKQMLIDWETTYGPQLDAMPESELSELAKRVPGGEDTLRLGRKSPLLRPVLLEVMAGFFKTVKG